MTCAACAAHIEKAVARLGVKQVEVNLLLNRMTVDTELDDGDIIAAVAGIGYGASVLGGTTGKSSAADDGAKALLYRFVSSLVFLLPLMYFSMGHMIGLPLREFAPHKNPSSFALIQLVLTTPILIINGRFFIGGLRALARRAPNMDTLVALGSGAAYIYGTVLLFAINALVVAGDVHSGAAFAMNLFFESAAMILTLVTLGKLLEAESKGKTRSEVDKLMRLRPQTATVVRDGEERTIAVDDVVVGDTVIVLPGEYIPCDGVITRGRTTLDKSAITGEFMPEEAIEGGCVTSAVLNLSGRVELRAEKVGGDSTLGKIIELIENAGGSKAPIQKIADKVSAIFVPTVCIIAAVTLVAWLIVGTIEQAFTFAISVLVISCPCALGLATPVAVMAGTGRAAAYGVLVKNAEVLQSLGGAEIFALDKTATITEGKPRVTAVESFGGADEKTVLRIAAALERTSTHPLAAAIIEAAGDGEVATDSTYRAGLGVVGKVGGETYALGNAKLMAEYGVTVDGAASVYLCKNSEPLGAITVEDEIKSNSCVAIKALRSAGARVVMITGDNAVQAERIAGEVGIAEVYCGVMPSGKLDIVEMLKKSGRTAMVGDGINDAPALKAADIGIAIGSGTDIAVDAADVVLVKSDLLDVPRVAAVSQATLRNVKQNIFWAFLYNTLCIPLAAGALVSVGITLNPMIAAAAMAFSSLFVVCNARRLTVMKFDGDKIRGKLRRLGAADGSIASEKIIVNNFGKGENMKTIFKVDGMNCEHCSARVEKAIKSVAGVSAANVNLIDGSATVVGEFDAAAVIAAVETAGYDCTRFVRD